MFRDVSDTGLNPSLWGTVQRQLDGSRWFVLLACPESAASHWVRQEVDHWCDTKGADTILLVLTGGELVWDREQDRFTDATTALAADVAARFAGEPLHLDLRWTDDLGRPPTLGDPRFKAEMARLASPIRDLPPAEIESEDVRLHRAARRLARAAVAALVTLAIVASIAAAIAVRNANEAERRARQAVARQLGLAALDMPARDLDAAMLVSVAASRLDPDPGADRYLATRTLLGRHSRLVALLQAPAALGEPSVRGVAISPTGDRVVATAWPSGGDPELVHWDLVDGGSPTTAPLAREASGAVALDDAGTALTPLSGTTVALGGDGSVAVEDTGTQARVVDVAEGRGAPPIAQWDGEPTAAALAEGRAAVVVGGTLRLVDTTRRTEVVGPADVGEGVTAVAVRDDLVVTAAAGELTWWEPAGDRLDRAAPPVAVDVGTIGQLVLDGSGRRAFVGGDAGIAIVDPGSVVTTDAGTGRVVPDPSGRFVAVVGTHLAVWDLARARAVLGVPEPMNAAAWSSCDGTSPCRLVSAGATIDVWEPGAGRRVRLADQTSAQAVDITADGETVVTAGWGATVAVWSLTLPIDDRGREQLTDTGGLTAFDSTTGIMATVAGTAVVLTAGDGSRTPGPAIEVGPVEALALTPGGERLVAVSSGVVHVFDVATGDPLALDGRCRTGIRALSPNGHWLAVHDPVLRQTALCDLTTSDAVAALGFAADADDPATESLAVDDDGSVAIAGGGIVAYRPFVDGAFAMRAEAVSTGYAGEDLAIPVLALRAGRVVAALDPHQGDLARVLVWDARRRGTPIQFETDHTDLGAVALLGSSGELLAVAGRFGDGDTVVQVWETENRRQLGRGLGGLGPDVRSLSGDAAAVVGVDATGRTFRWPLDLDPRREVCGIVGRDLTPAEWDSVAGGALARYEHDPVCDGDR